MRIRLAPDAYCIALHTIEEAKQAFGLRDWAIGVRIVTGEEMVANEGKSCFGAVRFHDQPRLATVLLLSDSDVMPGHTVIPIAVTVAHEVAHLVVGGLQQLYANLAATLSPDLKAEALAEGGGEVEMLCDTLARTLTHQREVAVWDEDDLPEGWEAVVATEQCPSPPSSPCTTAAKT